MTHENSVNNWNFEPRKINKNNMLLTQLQTSPETIAFQDVIAYIHQHYHFTPTKFTNGNAVNEAGQNNGSCKVFSFAKLKGLNEEETLALFGDFYRTDVLQNPEGADHQNIRNFMQSGWDGIAFEGEPLAEKE
ncbi:Type III effector HopPmaJ [Flavobacteriaceae bacterium 3519-10]|nr:Type III effector HopPmaJ [Flavobacteriaceae bacterium 3519-10]